MQNKKRYGFLMALALMGCSAAGPDDSRTELRIIGGKAGNAAAVPVVALRKPDSSGVSYTFCTGVAVDQRLILTAAHCSVDSTGKKYEPENVHVVFGENEPNKETVRLLAVQKIIPHPGFRRETLVAKGDEPARPALAHDLAVWLLQDPLEETVTTQLVKTEELDDVLSDGRLIRIMGYGVTSPWDSPFREPLLQEAETPFFKTVKIPIRKVVVVDGRRITRTEEVTFEGRTEGEFYAGGVKLPDTCKGDSGGPAWVKSEAGQMLLIGVTSRGANMCDKGGVYTLVPAYIDWINEQRGEINP
jgi:secreted trypsin-like serine protease